MYLLVYVFSGEKSGYAKATRTLMLEKGEKLHRKIVNEGTVLQEHRYRFKAYSKSFTGSDFGKWLIEIGEAGDAAEAVRLGQALLENGVIHHGMTTIIVLHVQCMLYHAFTVQFQVGIILANF